MLTVLREMAEAFKPARPVFLDFPLGATLGPGHTIPKASGPFCVMLSKSALRCRGNGMSRICPINSPAQIDHGKTRCERSTPKRVVRSIAPESTSTSGRARRLPATNRLWGSPAPAEPVDGGTGPDLDAGRGGPAARSFDRSDDGGRRRPGRLAVALLSGHAVVSSRTVF